MTGTRRVTTGVELQAVAAPRRASLNAGLLAVDLGGTWMRLAVFSADGSVLARNIVRTPRDDPAALSLAMREMLGRASAPLVTAVVGVPGPISYRDGMPLVLPNLPGWEPYVSASRLSEETGLRVLLANDADLAALGEHRFGAGRGVSDIVYLTVSTGVGAGVVIGGRLLHGRYSLGEAGHTIIERQPRATVQDLASGTALAGIVGVPGEQVTARARAGDPEALAAFRQLADVIAVAVHNLVHLFMPERFVIGGGVSKAGDLLFAPVRAEIDSCRRGCSIRGKDIRHAECDDDVGLLGGYAFWVDFGAQ